MEKFVDTYYIFFSLVFIFVQEPAHFALVGKEVEILRWNLQPLEEVHENE